MLKKLFMSLILFIYLSENGFEQENQKEEKIAEAAGEADFYVWKQENQKEEKIAKAAEKADFYGVWRVERVALEHVWTKGKTKEEYLLTGSGSDEADYVGSEIEFAPDFIRINNEVYKNPKYTFGSESIDDFNNFILFRATYLKGEETFLKAVDDLNDLIQQENIDVDYIYTPFKKKPEFLYFETNFDEKELDGLEYLYFPSSVCVINHDTLLTHSSRVLMLKRVE